MKAVLMMYKVFLRYPEALRPAFPKLKEKLEDPDPGTSIISARTIETVSIYALLCNFRCAIGCSECDL